MSAGSRRDFLSLLARCLVGEAVVVAVMVVKIYNYQQMCYYPQKASVFQQIRTKFLAFYSLIQPYRPNMMTASPISRKTFTKQRRALSAKQRQTTAFLASRHLLKLFRQLPRHAKIGIYLDDFGELPTDVIAKLAMRLGFEIYLPITKANQALRFAKAVLPITKTAVMRHHLGMLEPVTQDIIAAAHLDAIICPLVAVDMHGVRLGMGGGYYDRTFTKCTKTIKVAWCYEFQVVDNLPKQPWDQAVDMVLTEKRIMRV